MKQKTNPSQAVTKDYLDKALDERFQAYDKKMDGKFKLSEINTDIKLENLERKIDDKARGYRDEILTSNDKLAKTLETIREDIEIGNFQAKKQIKSHEERITHLEKVQASA